ncbi:MAG: ATP-binding protein, partial [Planctomycetes bacterium]|nr:ATP-binding protein [Planctomycetota bacterium]
RYWRLVGLTGGGPLTRQELRVDERILHHLAGVDHLDEQLAGYVAPAVANGRLAPSHARLAERIRELWSQPRNAVPLVQLEGNDAETAREVAARAAAALGAQLFEIDADVLPTAPEALQSLCRLWNREVLLAGGALVVDARGIDAGNRERERRVCRFLDGVIGPTALLTEQVLRGVERAAVILPVAPASRAEQRDAWRSALGGDVGQCNGRLEQLTSHFSLPGRRIESAILQARASAEPGEPLENALWQACRRQSRDRVSGLARRIEAVAGWDDLVLPNAQRELLRDIVTHVRRQVVVHETWGFAGKSSRGLGITALFAGPSGTGKTMAAEVLAHELELDLLHVDLSRVVSKYIGETEKNLGRVFDDAEAGGAILLFDEADALFGKRSEVKDSHDRYANLEISYLLQRMEAYRGLAILTTNLKQALDDAFQRRLRFVVGFPFPGPAARAEIWRRTIPTETPTEGLDFDRLGQLNAPGGTIRTIALHAAFMAADGAVPLRMPHLLAAARRVYAKSELSLTDAETRGWS